jgi:DinB superfamily
MTDILLKPMILDLLNTAHGAQQAFVDGLSDAERAAIGSADHWSARDHVAHITFWKQRRSLILAAVERNEIPPRFDDFESLNAQTFEEQHERSWADILHDAEQAHAELLAHVQSFTEDDLANPRLLPPQEDDDGVFPEGRPLWDLILGSGYWHPQSHFTQFHLDRNDVVGATRVQEAWIDNAIQRGVPPAIHGIGLYILACFYATTNQAQKAKPILQQALLLNPNLTEWSKQDPDLASLRGE